MFIASRRLASVSDSNASRRSPFNDGLVKVLKHYVGVIDGNGLLDPIHYLCQWKNPEGCLGERQVQVCTRLGILTDQH